MWFGRIIYIFGWFGVVVFCVFVFCVCWAFGFVFSWVGVVAVLLLYLWMLGVLCAVAFGLVLRCVAVFLTYVAFVGVSR